MKPPRLPLYAQFLGWLLINLMLLTGLVVVFAGRDGLGLQMLLTDPARERAQAVGDALSRQLAATPRERWPRTLADFSQRYGSTFSLEARRPRGGFPRLRDDARGNDRGGDRGPPRGAGPDFGGGAFDAGPGPGPGFGAPGFPPGPRRDGPRPPPDGAFVRLARSADGFQVRIPLATEVRSAGDGDELAVTTHGLWPLLRFLGISDWIGLGAGALLLSALWWWPFVYGITRRIRRLTRITERIAQGRLTDRAEPGRPDELGRLAHSVNRMGEQLHAQVEGQRQFLLDVAHELTSPLARMQVGLAIAQDELPEIEARRLSSVLVDAQQMSDLLQDLLQFSRSADGQGPPRLEPVDVSRLVREVCALELPEGAVAALVPPDLRVEADRPMLARALANLLRNAARHGADSAIEVVAEVTRDTATLRVADRGPGVPEAALAHLGEPFYRPDVARDRSTGGVGLGLAIVRRCVERCGGRLLLANRQGGGFEASLELRLASSGGASPLE